MNLLLVDSRCRTILLRLVPLLWIVAAILSLVGGSLLHPSPPWAHGLGLDNSNNIGKYVNQAASRVPAAWKKGKDGRPRVCGWIERTLGVATRVVLLGGGSTKSNSSSRDIVVEADSNRSALKGELQKLSIAVRNSKSPLGLLEIERLDVQGSNLKLGWTPLATTAGVPLILLVPPVRQTVWTVSIYYYVWSLAKKLAKRRASETDGTAAAATASSPIGSSSIARRMEATEVLVDRWRKRVLGGSPSRLRYEMVLSNDNVANSFLLLQSSKFLLRFLMKNSVLQTAAIVGDAVSDGAPPNSTPPQGPSKQLPSSLGALAKMDPSQQPKFSNDNLTSDDSPKNKLKRLLSATAFELREAPTFCPEDGKNHLQFLSVAILPDDQARLEFVLRTTLQAGNKDFFRLVQPECRFDVAEATSSLPLPKVVTGLLPKFLWLPIGPGVSLGETETTGNNNGISISDITVVPGGRCRIEGTLSVSQEPPTGGLVRR